MIPSQICVCWIIVAAISSLGTRSPAAVQGVRCRSKRAAATRRGRASIISDNWVRRDAAAVGHSCTRARRAAAKGRLEVPSPMLLWRAATGHSMSAGFQATGQPTNLSVAASVKHDLLLHCQVVEFDLVVLESLMIYVYVGS